MPRLPPGEIAAELGLGAAAADPGQGRIKSPWVYLLLSPGAGQCLQTGAAAAPLQLLAQPRGPAPGRSPKAYFQETCKNFRP